MPKNVRQTIRQVFKSIFTHFDWIKEQAKVIQQHYVDGINEYGNDYTEYISDLECLIEGTKVLEAAFQRFFDEKV